MNKEDKLVKRVQKIQCFLFQPFAQVFTGHESRLVKLKILLQDNLGCQAQHFAQNCFLHAG
jgi:F0F1-type ATP synthase beta subunit